MRDLVIYGLGELGQLYGAAALRAGMRVTPIIRASAPDQVLAALPSDVPVLVAVAENALDEVLPKLGQTRAESVILLQNELFPAQWQRHGLAPTVLVPWLLKKRGTALTVARETPVYGRLARLVCELHAALDIPAVELSSEASLRQAIVEKYAFILTINALGVLRDRTLALWLQEDRGRVRALAEEATVLGAALCGEPAIDHARCIRAVEEGMHALATMTARGRSAPARVARALEHARTLGLSLPELSQLG